MLKCTVKWLSTIGKYAFPILKRLFHVATNTAEDVLTKDRPVLSSLKEHAIKEVKDTVKRGLGKRKASINRSFLKRSMTTPPLFTATSSKRLKKRKKKKKR